MNDNQDFDVIIVGGSYAGLSAAMALGRSMRRTLLIDSGLPCNWQTPHSHNFLTNDGAPPREIAVKAREQVLKYDTVTLVNDLAISGQRTQSGFGITTKSGGEFRAKKLIFATGIKDVMPDIPGFSACWGISVVHCPYCHGYEFRDRKTAVLLNGEKAIHITALVRNLSKDLTVLTSGKAEFTDEETAKLQHYGIRVVENEVAAILHEGGYVTHVEFKDGSTMPFDAVYAPRPFDQHSNIPLALGCELTEHGYIRVDSAQKTTVHGVFACGDNSNTMRSVSAAVSTGGIAGAVVNHELTTEQF